MKDKAISAMASMALICIAVTVLCAVQMAAVKPDLERLSEYDALLAECGALIPEGAYCELIARQRRESNP